MYISYKILGQWLQGIALQAAAGASKRRSPLIPQMYAINDPSAEANWGEVKRQCCI